MCGRFTLYTDLKILADRFLFAMCKPFENPPAPEAIEG